MITIVQLAKRLRRDRDGIAMVEFAIIAPVFCLMLMGVMDLGYSAYVRSTLSGALEAGARKASVGQMSSSQVDYIIKQKVVPLLSAAAAADPNTITITKKSFVNFSRFNKPEKMTKDTDGDGTLDVGDCYEDANVNDTFDSAGGVNGLGGADDVVYYDVVLTVPRVFPMAGLLGWPSNMEIRTKTFAKNQPFGQQTPPIKCQK